MFSFKPTFPLSSFTFIQRFFSSSSLSAIRVVSSAYLRLLIFLPAILIPACASSSPAFLMMYSAYKLNKQGNNIQPWRTPFPVWNQSVVPCPVLTDLHTGFSRGRSGGLVFPSLSEFSTVYCDPHSQSFGIVNKTDINGFLELSYFFHDPADVGNLISGSSAFSKTSLNIRKFTVHILLKPGLENLDRKSTRLNSSHHSISYAVFCLKKKKIKQSIDAFLTPKTRDGHLKASPIEP